ncbi:MAG: hypothetical protein AAF824_25165 [Bacteroidota bacterium]
MRQNYDVGRWAGRSSTGCGRLVGKHWRGNACLDTFFALGKVSQAEGDVTLLTDYQEINSCKVDNT